MANIVGAQRAQHAEVDRLRASVESTAAVQPSAAVTESAPPTAVPAPAMALYSDYPEPGGTFGTLSIPVLKQKLPIIQGTSDADLKKGVGHFLQSVLPGEVDNCVLSGHRDSFFSELGKLKIGDRVIAKTSAGTFTYQVKRIRIVGKDDRTVIVPTETAVLTLSTCYPFHYVGNAPKRYIVVADMVTGE